MEEWACGLRKKKYGPKSRVVTSRFIWSWRWRNAHNPERHLIGGLFGGGLATRIRLGYAALYDVTLLGTSASSLMLTGHERVEATIPDKKDRMHGQTWLVQPTHEADVMAIEGKWRDAAREREELQLRALLDERLRKP